MKPISLAFVVLGLLVAPAMAAEATQSTSSMPQVPPPQTWTLTMKDMQDLQVILQEQVPSKWAQPIISWANDVLQNRRTPTSSASLPPEKK